MTGVIRQQADLDRLIKGLEDHSQIASAHYYVNTMTNWMTVRALWKAGGQAVWTVSQAENWLREHPPRCWSWTGHTPKSKRETERDYCTLSLNHPGLHKGDHKAWGSDGALEVVLEGIDDNSKEYPIKGVRFVEYGADESLTVWGGFDGEEMPVEIAYIAEQSLGADLLDVWLVRDQDIGDPPNNYDFNCTRVTVLHPKGPDALIEED